MEFNKLVHQPTRLQIFSYLYANGETSFTELQTELGITDGNLATHIEKMETADSVAVEKQFVDRKPQTTYYLTDTGRNLFEEHIQTLETLIDSLEE